MFSEVDANFAGQNTEFRMFSVYLLICLCLVTDTFYFFFVFPLVVTLRAVVSLSLKHELMVLLPVLVQEGEKSIWGKCTQKKSHHSLSGESKLLIVVPHLLFLVVPCAFLVDGLRYINGSKQRALLLCRFFFYATKKFILKNKQTVLKTSMN